MNIRKLLLGTLCSAIFVTATASTAMAGGGSSSGIAVDNNNFPDPEFYSYIVNNIDDGDYVLYQDEINRTESIYLSGNVWVNNLIGLDNFTELKTLNIEGCVNIKSLDLSGNKKLEELNVKNTGLTSINTKSCAFLCELDITETDITQIDISGNPNLIATTFFDSEVVNGNEQVYFDKASTLKTNTGVKVITGYPEGTIALNNKYFPDDMFLYYVVKFDKNSDGFLTPEERNAVYEIDLSGRPVDSIEGIRYFPELIYIHVEDSLTEPVDLSYNTKLHNVSLPSYHCSTITLGSNLKDLTILDLGDNHLNTIDISGCPNLKTLIISGANTKINKLDFVNNKYLVDTYEKGLHKFFWTDNGYEYNNHVITYSDCIIHMPMVDRVVLYKGWHYDNNHWSYFDNEGYIVDGWRYIDGKWYFFTYEGVMETGWVKVHGQYYYLSSSGAMVTGWQKLGDDYYYFNSSGVMQTGWQKLGGIWYYLKPTGAMATGWQSIGGKWYYFESSGAMVTGWKQISGKWYYLDTSGAMVIGWKQIGANWYYFDSDGVMQTGWKQISGKYYYFYSSGAMASNTWIGSYYVNASGVWVS